MTKRDATAFHSVNNSLEDIMLTQSRIVQGAAGAAVCSILEAIEKLQAAHDYLTGERSLED